MPNQTSTKESQNKPGQFVSGDPILDHGIKVAQGAQKKQIEQAMLEHNVPMSHIIGDLIKQSPIFQQQQQLMTQNNNLLPSASPISPAVATDQGIQKAGFFGGLFGKTENDILMERSRAQNQVASQASTLSSLLGLAQQAEEFPGKMRLQAEQIAQQPLQSKKLLSDLMTSHAGLKKTRQDIETGETEQNIKKTQLEQMNQDSQVNMEMRKKSATDFAELAPKAIAAAKTLQELAPVMKEMGEFETGLLEQFGGRTRAFNESFSKNPNFLKFDRLVNKVLPSLAKLGGDTGVLSNPDIDRWKSVLGDKSAPISSKIESVNELMSDLQVGLSARAEMGGFRLPPSMQKMIMEFQPIEIAGASGGKGGTTPQLPTRSSAPKGAKGWDTEKGAWVY